MRLARVYLGESAFLKAKWPVLIKLVKERKEHLLFRNGGLSCGTALQLVKRKVALVLEVF